MPCTCYNSNDSAFQLVGAGQSWNFEFILQNNTPSYAGDAGSKTVERDNSTLPWTLKQEGSPIATAANVTQYPWQSDWSGVAGGPLVLTEKCLNQIEVSIFDAHPSSVGFYTRQSATLFSAPPVDGNVRSIFFSEGIWYLFLGGPGNIATNPGVELIANNWSESMAVINTYAYCIEPDPYAPWGGFANWQRLRLLEYV